MGTSEMHEPASSDSATQDAKTAELRELVAPLLEGKPGLKLWCNDARLRQFLRARRWDVPKAMLKLENTLNWRETERPDEYTFEDIKEESRTGKTYIMEGRDRAGRVVVVMRPRCQNTSDPDQQIKFLVYCLEQACRKADQSDFEGYSRKNAASARVGRQTLQILQNYYPERLGLAICYHPPWLFLLLWKIVSPLLDPVTYEKVRFCESGPKGDEAMALCFDMDLVEECMGGRAPPAFDFAKYEQQQLEEERLRRKIAA